MAGIEVGHIPYSGTAPAVVDIVAGRVSLMFAAAAPSLPLIKEGSLRALGVTSTARLAEAPEMPPIADAIPGFNASQLDDRAGSRRYPRGIVSRLHDELKAIMAIAGRAGADRQNRHDALQAVHRPRELPPIHQLPRSHAGARSCSKPALPGRCNARITAQGTPKSCPRPG